MSGHDVADYKVYMDCQHSAIYNLSADLLTVGSLINCRVCTQVSRVTAYAPDITKIHSAFTVLSSVEKLELSRVLTAGMKAADKLARWTYRWDYVAGKQLTDIGSDIFDTILALV